MKNKPPFLKELKELDPERLKNIREKALEVRRASGEKMQNFKDLLKGALSVCVYLRDKNGNLIKDKKGRPVEITKKELMVLNAVDKTTENPTIKDIVEIGEILGEINRRQENNVNLIFENLRNELVETN